MLLMPNPTFYRCLAANYAVTTLTVQHYAIDTLFIRYQRGINLLLPHSQYAINEQRPSLCRTSSPCALINNELAAKVLSIRHWNAINKLRNVPPAANQQHTPFLHTPMLLIRFCGYL